MEILQAEKEDAVEILALQKLAFLSEARIYNDYTLPPLVQTLAELEEDFTRKTFLKAVSGGSIVGSVNGCMDSNICRIGRLVVHPALQGRGIGTRLMHSIEAVFSDAGFWEVFTGELSLGNMRLYKRLGYQVRKKERFSDNRFAVVFLRKSGTVDITGPT
ncbi:MAG TPA: GNAT family N-acetyltransferase [Geobacteraceae bacterium]|nr:GNAT family N-acetyltransferase [Geobacteraceae bacterium]